MIQVTQIRKKCIGCNACAEMDPGNWRMSRKDGKATLIHAKERKGYFNLELPSGDYVQQKQIAAACASRCILIKKL